MYPCSPSVNARKITILKFNYDLFIHCTLGHCLLCIFLLLLVWIYCDGKTLQENRYGLFFGDIYRFVWVVQIWLGFPTSRIERKLMCIWPIRSISSVKSNSNANFIWHLNKSSSNSNSSNYTCKCIYLLVEHNFTNLQMDYIYMFAI